MSWVREKLSELTVLIKRGVSPKYVLEGGIPIINQRCIRNNRIDFNNVRLSSKEKKITEVKYLKVGDTLVNSTGVGTLGRTAFIKELKQATSVDTHVTIVRPNKIKIHDRYLSFFLNSIENEIENMGKGATGQTELSAGDLSELIVPYPKSKITQTRIANILSAYDDLIENNLKRIKLLEQAAQNIYKEWFVNMRFPGHESSEFDSEIGLPEGWKTGKVSDLCLIKSGFAFKSSQWTKEGNPVLKIKNITNNTIDFEQTDFIGNEVANIASNYEIYEGDVLIAMTGATVGKVGLVPKNRERIYLNQRVGLFRPLEDVNNIPLIFTFFMTDNAQQQILNYAQGAAQPNISTFQIGQIEILIPDNELLKSFKDLVSPFLKQIQMLYFQNGKLKAARDILLPRLMNQTIEV